MELISIDNERNNFWKRKIERVFDKSYFLIDKSIMDFKKEVERSGKKTEHFRINIENSNHILKITNNSDEDLFMFLTASLTALINKYSQIDEVSIGSVGFDNVDGGHNYLVIIENMVSYEMSFDELIKAVKEEVSEIRTKIGFDVSEIIDLGDAYAFEVFVSLSNIQKKVSLENARAKIGFNFERNDSQIVLDIEYCDLFNRNTIERIARHYSNLAKNILENTSCNINDLDILDEKEKTLILSDFCSLKLDYPEKNTIAKLFEEQAERTPFNTAVEFMEEKITYKDLNERANKLSNFLINNGVTPETVIGVMLDRSIEMVASLIAILKAGGAYLPIDPSYPADRIMYMLENSGARYLITSKSSKEDINFTSLRNFESNKDYKIIQTNPRSFIKEFDALPVPDRTLIDFRNYKNKIGMASVTNCISIQSTRGCPYKCLYCHKIWAKSHVCRSAENLYNEIEYYYKNGVTNFAFIDDIFNLNKQNSSEFLKKIIKNKLKVQLFFPNGLRGDRLPDDYIDLMVEAGTRLFNLSLETASPRLQKLLKKDLDLDQFGRAVNYIATKHPNVILELATMHGFPTETEQEAMMTLDFIKSVKWLHFAYIHILKIFPNTEMELFALENGILKQDIMNSRNRAFHDLPDTLPFPKSFTRQYQAMFMNEYVLSKDRLRQVLPVQMKIMTEEALVQKYNGYLPTDIKCLEDILNFTRLDDFKIPSEFRKTKNDSVEIFSREPVKQIVRKDAKRILFLDLSQHYSSYKMLYKVVEQPLGLICLGTYLKKEFGDKLEIKICKSGNDFDSYAELKDIVNEFKPDLIGIRTLTFFKEFFHETVSLLRLWGVKVPIVAGGPYASSDYDYILKDKNVNIAAVGEGEITISELVGKMFENGFKLPSIDELKKIDGIVFAEDFIDTSCNVLLLENIIEEIKTQSPSNPQIGVGGNNLAYVMYTSGSTGRPKGVMIEHRQVNNCISWMQNEFKLDEKDVAVQRTNLTFDPSVWEIFWPLYVGASVKLLTSFQSKDPEYLIKLLSKQNNLTTMYCPASMVNAMMALLETGKEAKKLSMPLLFIGAEAISRDVVNKFYKYFNGRIVNTYGPTECTINNTFTYIGREEEGAVPIGKPIANNSIYILSKAMQLVPVGVQGEIYIAGKSVGRGYINNKDNTDKGFVSDHLGKGVMFKTGDIAKWREDGDIEILGRNDEQIKIRGYRIELGEIESNMKKYPGITDCIVAVKDMSISHKEINTCKHCGITTAYPRVNINEDGKCNVCADYVHYDEIIKSYFKTSNDLDRLIKESEKTSPYDCMILYSGGLGAAYALYRLVEMGHKVLAVTYDNGYFPKSDLKNIEKITSVLGVEHVFLKHEKSDDILRESLNTANTVCKGCFHVSSVLAGEYALRNNIKYVIGATLSRGQIIENKLSMFIQQGINDVSEIENGITKVQLNIPNLDKEIFDKIGINASQYKEIYDNINFVDFYRYENVTNQEIISYLQSKDEYWKRKKKYAIYSTNCPLKQIGDFAHLKGKDYHFYGSATSWEKRLGHIGIENIKEDLAIEVSEKALGNFSKRLGYSSNIEKQEDRRICAYYLSETDIPLGQIKEFLSDRLPSYMIPAHMVKINEVPYTNDGKVDKKKLPIPVSEQQSSDKVDPADELEQKLLEIYCNILKADKTSIGITDNFFDIGGDSLKMTQLVSKVLSEVLNLTGEDLYLFEGLADLMQIPTIQGFAEYIRKL